MVRLEEPVDDELPVEGLAEDVGALAHVVGHVEFSEFVIEFAEVRRDVDGSAGSRSRDYPDQSVTFLDRHLDEPVGVAVYRSEPVVVRDRPQPAGRVVRPGVVRTGEPSLVAAGRQLHRRTAVAAHVVEATKNPIVAAHDQQRSARQVVDEEVAWRSDVAAVTDDDRKLREQTLAFTPDVSEVDVSIDGMAHHVVDHRVEPRIEVGDDPVEELGLSADIHHFPRQSR